MGVILTVQEVAERMRCEHRTVRRAPRVPAGEAIRQAREEVCGTHSGRTHKFSMTGSRRIPCNYRNGRYWARTSDLRLVEAALSQLS
jgi:hypothetical protein